MIRKITFENFYSFKDKQIIDFTTSKKKSSIYHQSFDDKQITKIAGFVGPNNSGKTNITKLLGFLRYLITTPDRSDLDLEEDDTGYKCFAFGSKKESFIEIEFETKEHLCSYFVKLTQTEILKEKLEIKKLRKYSKPIEVFTRELSNIRLNKNLIKGVTSKRLSNIRKDVALIAFIRANYNEEIIDEVSEYFEQILTNVNEGGYVHTPEERMEFVARIYNEVPEFKKEVDEFIKNFNLGIEGFEINKINKGFEVNAIHKVKTKKMSLPIYYESRGTKSLFVDLLHIIICTDSYGQILVLDEIEIGLHPEAVNKLVQFIAEKFSKEKKQFIFATHYYDFLKKFDSQQVYLVEKKKHASEVYRLDELKVRPDENYYKKYLSGAYGAYPEISV